MINKKRELDIWIGDSQKTWKHNANIKSVKIERKTNEFSLINGYTLFIC